MVALQIPEARALRSESTDAADSESEAVVEEGIGHREGAKIAVTGQPVANRAERRGALHLDAIPAAAGALAEAVRMPVGLDPSGTRVLALLGQRLAGGVHDPQVDALGGRSRARAGATMRHEAAAAEPPSRKPGMPI